MLVPLIASRVAAGAVFCLHDLFDETTVALFIAVPDARGRCRSRCSRVREQISLGDCRRSDAADRCFDAVAGAAADLLRRQANAAR